jgi:hypothetical protein
VAEKRQDAILPSSPTLAAAVGALTDIAGNAALDTAITAGAGATKSAIKGALPLRVEQTAEALTKAKTGGEALRRAADKTISQADHVRDAQVRQLKELQQRTTGPVRQGEEALRASTAGAATPEAVGQQFIEKTFPEKLKASREGFNKRYEEVIKEGKAIPASGEKVLAQTEKTLAEKGVAGTPSATKGEVAAEKLQKALDVEDTTAASLRDQLPQGFDQMPQAVQKQILEKAGISLEPARAGATNLGDLVLERQRLKGAARAAYESGNYNVARQLDDLTKSTMKEIETANKGFAEKVIAIDKDYAVKHAPFFGPKAPTRQAANRSPETVLDRFIPPKGAPNRVEQATRARELVDNPDDIKRSFLSQGVAEADKGKSFGEGFVKWWDKYSDSKTGDKVLKTWLGDDYNHISDTVQRFRTVKPKSVDKAFSDTIAELNNRASAAGQFALKNRDAAIKKLERDTAAQVKEIVGERMDPKRIKNYGMFLMIEGGVSQIIGSPTGTLRGLAGGLMVMSPNMMAKLINAPGGAQLIRRGLRALPGTTQAAAVARQLQNFSRSLPDTEDEPQ